MPLVPPPSGPPGGKRPREADWVDAVNGTGGVMDALYALNTSRPCTGTADSRVFPDFFPGTTVPAGEPGARSGITGDVIHFNATQQTVMGHQYWAAYQRALGLGSAVPSSRTAGCGKKASMHMLGNTNGKARAVTQCGSSGMPGMTP